MFGEKHEWMFLNMNMMSKCAKFHVDIPSRYRLKLIPASEDEL